MRLLEGSRNLKVGFDWNFKWMIDYIGEPSVWMWWSLRNDRIPLYVHIQRESLVVISRQILPPKQKIHEFFFYVLLNVHLSISILVGNQLDAQNLFYNKFISCLYMFRANVLIVRKSKFYYTASGIITLKKVSGVKLLK